MKADKFFRWTSIVLIAILLAFSTTAVFSQKENPPGTILLKENIYIDETPVCNVQYREYEYFMRNFLHFDLDGLENFVKELPYYKFDMSVLFKKTKFSSNPDSLKYIITDTAKTFWNNWTEYKTYLYKGRFNFFPVVNISYNVAAGFCRWRTFIVKVLYSAREKRKDRKKAYDNFVYRLPTKEELEFAATKFISDKKIQFQPKNQSDSLPYFMLPENKTKRNLFIISSLEEIAMSNNIANKVYWDTKYFSLLTRSILRKNEVNENMTFRCVCEVKENSNQY